MNTIYYELPYNKVLNYLRNNVANDDLDVLYDKYNIEPDKNISNQEQLADVISDEDMINLGFTFDNDSESTTSQSDYCCYDNVDDIVKFLSTLDSYTIDQLSSHYDCFNLEDLAIALSDHELQDLGYSYCCEDSVADNDELSGCEYYDGTYCQDLDYLEDIPNDLKFIIISPADNLFATDSEADYLRLKESLDATLVDDCEPTHDNYGITTNKFLFKVNPHRFEVQEDVIINTELNPNIFDSEHNVLPEVKEQIMDYVGNFIKKMSGQGIGINYSDIDIVGSNAGYLYTPESDLDVHIVSSQPIDLDVAERLFDEFDIYEAENPLFIGNSKVELGIEDGYDIIMDNKAERRYSLVHDGWVDNSDELEQFKPEDVSAVSGYEDIVNEYTDKINKAVDSDNYAQAVSLKQEIRQNRSDDLANIGSLSMGNVVFKELRNNGSYGKLKEYLMQKEIKMGD